MSILIDIYFIIFGSKPEHVEPKNDPLFKDILEFKKMDGDLDPSLPAIRKWFPLTEGYSVPSRLSAIQFLDRYLQSKKDHPEIVGLRAEKFAIVEAFFQKQILEIEARHQRQSQTRPPRRPRRENYRNILERLDAFKGTYQIIRPYASDPARYVLEPMTISAKGHEPSFSLYSHNFPEPKYLYQGHLTISERYCTGIAHRTHEKLYPRTAARSIMLDIDLVRQAKGYAPRYCFAGIMLRGVTSRKTAIAVPFVAIRSPTDVNLSTAKIEQSSKADTIKHIDRTILIGHFGHGRLFDFCERLFRRLEFLHTEPPDEDEGKLRKIQPIIATSAPRHIATCIAADATTASGYFAKWQSEAREFFSEFQEN